MTRAEAKASQNTRYNGKICELHPSRGGERMTANGVCVACQFQRAAEYKTKHPDKLKAWTKASRQKHRAARAIRDKARTTNPATRPAYLAYQREYYALKRKPKEAERSAKRRLDPDYNAKQIERKRLWRDNNRERHQATSRAYDRKQMRENIQRRISKNLRHRLGKAMLGKTRGASAVTDLGMSIAEFRVYIEQHFRPGMSWDNYGAWHIDHKRPLASFDLSNPNEAREACHFTNLQPLWAADNQKKHRSYAP